PDGPLLHPGEPAPSTARRRAREALRPRAPRPSAAREGAPGAWPISRRDSAANKGLATVRRTARKLGPRDPALELEPGRAAPGPRDPRVRRLPFPFSRPASRARPLVPAELSPRRRRPG